MLGKLRHGTRKKVREVVDDSEIVDEIFRYFGADQTLDFFHSIATNYGVF